jgi:hypothetical protein
VEDGISAENYAVSESPASHGGWFLEARSKLADKLFGRYVFCIHHDKLFVTDNARCSILF